MTPKESVNWLINLTADIGKSEHRDLWHYEQALDEIKETLEGEYIDVARERYEDLCEYFNNNPHTIELILNDRKEFKAWLERLHWHVLECDKLARKLEALEGKDNIPDTNVGDIIPLDWIQKYADDWEVIGYAYDNPILGMLEDWRSEQDE